MCRQPGVLVGAHPKQGVIPGDLARQGRRGTTTGTPLLAQGNAMVAAMLANAPGLVGLVRAWAGEYQTPPGLVTSRLKFDSSPGASSRPKLPLPVTTGTAGHGPAMNIIANSWLVR